MKLSINKRILPFLLTGVMAVSMTGCSSSRADEAKNHTGHSDFSYAFNFSLDPDEFILLNVGDHDSLGVLFQDKKMEVCNEKDISLGIVVSSDAQNEEDIYNDVEYVKGLIRDYKIDFPVYLNIDHIITDDSLNNEMKTKIIQDFLEKCSANHIYVGISGTDTNLCRVKEYCGITGYDAYVIQDSEEIQYDGTYYVYKDLNGVIHSDVNLAKSIKNKKLNREEGFLSDGSYTIAEGESITDVALKYGMSVNEILRFNNMSKIDIEPGKVVRIPSIISTGRVEGEGFKKLEEPIRGCDISYAQGDSCDWDLLSENFEYIILRCSHGLVKDDCFEENAQNCNINNIPMGVYCYNEYFDFNCENYEYFTKKQLEQADYCLSLLKNKQIEYPVYLDIEKSGGIDNKSLTEEQVRTMLDIWFNKVEESGYIPGIYCSKTTFDYLQSCVNYPISDKFQVWIAGGDQYSHKFSDPSEIEPDQSILNSPKIGASMVQVTDKCQNAGAGNSDGYLDIDFSNVDYTSGVILDENFEIKDFNRYDLRVPLILGSIGVVGAGGIVLGNKIRKKNKQKVKS